MQIIPHIAGFALLLTLALTVYRGCNKGMARNARGQQTRRLTVAALLAVLPVAVAQAEWTERTIVMALLTGVAWMVTYPLLYHLTFRRSSPDYENYMDITFGLYIFGWLSGLVLIGRQLPAMGGVWMGIVAVIESVLLFAALFQWVYYLIYKVCLDTDGMKILQETHWNEMIEFSRSFSLWQNVATILPVVLLPVGCFWMNLSDTHTAIPLCPVLIVAGLTVFFSVYVWKLHHGVFIRTGLAALFLNVKEYVTNNNRYVSEMESRVKDLTVEPLGMPDEGPVTYLMVIGESACRDFMSAFHPEMDEDTTPWLRAMAADERHTLLFPNAYSCAMQTVPTLEKALTEYNQYRDDKPFYASCSLIDIARKMGFRTHWYSNQGHLGVADTPITLVAETSDVAKWTHQEVGKVQYDEQLLAFLDEIDPRANNFVVLHLKGSHFNFMSRYPQSFTRWGTPGVQDNVVNYKNSIAYTDSVLQQAFEYAQKKLNLRAMLYFSDHATEPGRRRKPNFDGFQMTRIPMFAYLSEEYITRHQRRYDMLKANRERHFTNDLTYDLVCGIFDIASNHFDETQSLSSDQYRFTREMLLTYEGKKHIAEDDGTI